MCRTQQAKQGKGRYTIQPNLNKTIEFMSIKLNLTNNESMMVCLYYGKQESRSTKKESEN